MSALTACKRWDRQKYLLNMIGIYQIWQKLRRLNRYTVQLTTPKMRGIVEKSNNGMTAGNTKSSGQLRGGCTGTIDDNSLSQRGRRLGSLKEQIAEDKTNTASESRQQQPEKGPTAARWHLDRQKSAQQIDRYNDDSITSSDCIQGVTTHIAGEPTVLTSYGIETQTNRPSYRQKPEAAHQS
jgi:hypothetical protein